MDFLRVGLIICFVAVIGALMFEVSRRNTPLVSLVPRRQFGLRVLAAVLFLLLIGMIFAGTYWVVDSQPLIQLMYWTLCLALSILIVILAVLDVRGVLINYLVERRNMLKDSSQRSGHHDDANDR
ncbi:MAG: hypothetical protein WCL39_08780 [Armatimonadota bacterium]